MIEVVDDVPETAETTTDVNEAEETESTDDRLYRLEKFAEAYAAREGFTVDGLIEHAIRVGNVDE